MKSAEQGVSLAKFIVGYMYAHGQGVPRSDTEAEMWFSSAALTGPAELFMNIGMSYEYGINGICHNEVEAARWYKYGVDMGHEQCIICWNSVMRSLGGEPREPFDDRVSRISSTEAQREIDEREVTMARADDLLDRGEEKSAYRLYGRAAELGSPEAMFNQAMMMHQGIGVDRDDIGAIKLLSRAAPLTPFTPHTETDAAALLASLPACREAGFAVENGEYKIGLRSISAPVFTGGGTLKYVVSVLGMFRSVHSDEFAHAERAVVAAGQMLSAALGYQG